MSHNTYNKLWADGRRVLNDAATVDNFLQNEPHQAEVAVFHKAVSEVYYKYIVAANKLQQAYDQIVHPQKRLLIRKLLDGSLCRMLELKADLELCDMSEHSYNDDVLIKLRLSPIEAELKVPQYFRNNRLDDIKYKREFIENTLQSLGYEEIENRKIQLTELEAIKIIQIHERARQGRLRCIFMKEIRLLKEQGKPEIKEEISYVSALMIQKMWRGFIDRRKVKKRKMEEMVLIGMIPPTGKESDIIAKLETNEVHRRQVQAENEAKYIEALETIETKIRDKQGVLIMEEITDEIRHWFRAFYDNSNSLPEFPTEEEGGSRAMFARAEEDEDSANQSSKGSKKGKDKDGKKAKGEKKKEEKKIFGFKTTPTLLLPNLMQANDEYEEVWKHKDESNNINQTYDENIIKLQKYNLVEVEVRNVADELMRAELEILQAALDVDRGQKTKKKKPKKGRKGGKKGKKKKEKDLTPDRTTESLFEELITNGIIKKYPETPIDSFIGESSYAAFDDRKQGKNPLPSMGDIRHLVKQYCIVPMGSETLHETLPLVKSILITGPHGSGKTMLVHAICTEIGAVLFDLSPSNLVDKYPGKPGLIMLVHLVYKMSRLLQPSVILLDEAEKPFLRKVPKTDLTDPKRLKKDIPKLIKGISAEDRILIVGASSVPWDADVKSLMSTFQKVIMIPRPDYGTVSLLWKTQLRQYTGISPLFEVSAIAKLSDGYTVGEILKVIKSVITTKRMLQLRVIPLTAKELILALSKHDPVFGEEDEAAEQFWWKTPIGRAKLALIEEQAGNKKKK